MTDPQALAPCPWCGGGAYIAPDPYYAKKHGLAGFRVICHECGAQGPDRKVIPKIEIDDSTSTFITAPEAIAAWNGGVLQTEVAKLDAKLKSQDDFIARLEAEITSEEEQCDELLARAESAEAELAAANDAIEILRGEHSALCRHSEKTDQELADRRKVGSWEDRALKAEAALSEQTVVYAKYPIEIEDLKIRLSRAKDAERESFDWLWNKIMGSLSIIHQSEFTWREYQARNK